MAKITPGAIISEIRGKVAATFFQHQPGGLVARRRVVHRAQLSERSARSVQQQATLRQRWHTLPEATRQAMIADYGSNLHAMQVYSTIGSIAMYAGLWFPAFIPRPGKVVETVQVTQADDTRVRLQITQPGGTMHVIYSALFVSQPVPPGRRLSARARYRFATAGTIAIINRIDFPDWLAVSWGQLYDPTKRYRLRVFFLSSVTDQVQDVYLIDLPL